VRLRIHGKGNVFVTVRRADDCSLRGRYRVNLDRSQGRVVLRGRVNRHRLAPGTYVVAITRDAAGQMGVRSVILEVGPRGHVRVKPVKSSGVCERGTRDAVALAGASGWPGNASLADVVSPNHSSSWSESPAVHVTAAQSKTLRGRPPPAVGAIDTPANIWGLVIVIGLVGTLLLGMAAYVWRFLKTPGTAA
jgi:hypothetical protein